MYLLDTCTVSDYVKVYSKKLNDTLMSHAPSQLFISVITMEEIEYGFAKHPKAKDQLGGRIYKFIETITQQNILPIDEATATLSGKIRAELNNKGLTIGQYDLLIAASAIIHDKTLVTANTKHFKDIPLLTIENWR